MLASQSVIHNPTINDVVTSGLCTSCGTCIGMCPQSAIKLILNDSKKYFIPFIDDVACTSCGICLRVCPGYAINLKELQKTFHQNIKNGFPVSYIGHAIDNNVRYNASSGGMVTALLLFALEHKLIDGAIVTKMSKDNPLQPITYIAKTAEDIISASKSKYCPTSINTLLKEIHKNPGKFAIVGLPCQIQGIRKAEIADKTLRDKIVLHISLFCSHNDTFFQTNLLLRRLNIFPQDVSRIDYRGKGWPGKTTVYLKDGSSKEVPYIGSTLHGLWFYALNRCEQCFDITGLLSDISLGDAWLVATSQDIVGSSLVISRNEVAEELVKTAVFENKIKLTKVSFNEINQSSHFIRRQRDVNAHLKLRKIFHKRVPNYYLTLPPARASNYLRNLMIFLNIRLSHTFLMRFTPAIYKLELSFIGQIEDNSFNKPKKEKASQTNSQ